LQKTIPLFITSIHDPGGVTRRGAIANLAELVLITSQSPAAVYKVAEDRYRALLSQLRPIISKRNLSKDDWGTFGDFVTKFREDLLRFSPEFGIDVVNLPQAIAEDLERDVNTIEAYLIYADARRSKPTLPEGSPEDGVLESLRTSGKPMTPRQISATSGVNYNTVRRVVQELLRDGKIARATGRGAYVINAGHS
jgi:hypothetical protein